MKEWVIADIHGCYKTLRNLIENKLQPATGDSLFFLGDYIDRGPGSFEVVEYIMQLQSDTNFNVITLMGNHEQCMLEALKAEDIPTKSWFSKPQNKLKNTWISFGGNTTLKSYNTLDLRQLPESHVHWYKSLQLWHEHPLALMAHAGFNFKNENIFEDTESMLWTRDFTPDLNKTQGRQVLHGHVPVSIDLIKQSIDQPDWGFIDLDNGCVFAPRRGQGQLVAFEMHTRQLEIQACVDVLD